ncbi:MAG: hypothetical protein ACOC6G_03780 [Thermoproteota archaeon]
MSTSQTVRSNLSFLRKTCGDRSSPVVFCKMISYAETDIEHRLIEERCLEGSIVNPDYELQDPRVDRLCTFLHQTFYRWMFGSEGLLAHLRWHRFEVAVLGKFYTRIKNISQYEEFLRSVVASSNALFLDTAEKAAALFQNQRPNLILNYQLLLV